MSRGRRLAFFVAALAGLILAHELGHLLAGLWLGRKPLELALGFGPRVTGFEAGGFAWNLRLVPLGGFVRFPEVAGPDFSPWAHALVAVAGVAVNGLVGAVLVWLAALRRGVASGPGGLVPWVVGRAHALVRDAKALGAESPFGTLYLGAHRTTHHRLRPALATAFLSLELALFNLVPMPGLDGYSLIGHLQDGVLAIGLPLPVEWAVRGAVFYVIGSVVWTAGRALLVEFPTMARRLRGEAPEAGGDDADALDEAALRAGAEGAVTAVRADMAALRRGSRAEDGRYRPFFDRVEHVATMAALEVCLIDDLEVLEPGTGRTLRIAVGGGRHRLRRRYRAEG